MKVYEWLRCVDAARHIQAGDRHSSYARQLMVCNLYYELTEYECGLRSGQTDFFGERGNKLWQACIDSGMDAWALHKSWGEILTWNKLKANGCHPESLHAKLCARINAEVGGC